MPEPLRIVINQDLCIGAGACEFLAPELVVVGDDGVARLHATDQVSADAAAALARACPSGAFGFATGEPDAARAR